MQRHVAWIAKERAHVRRDQAPVRWTDGSTILLDGEVTTIAVRRTGESVTATYGTRVVRVKDVSDVRPVSKGISATLPASAWCRG